MKITGISEQYDGGREVHVQQEGSHVMLSVADSPGSGGPASVLLTPDEAKAIAAALLSVGDQARNIIMEGIA
jgi:hypothetical protein